jgi:hypothetical protein
MMTTPAGERKYLRRFFVLLKFAVSIFFIYVLTVKFVDLSDFVDQIRHLRPIILLFLIITPFTLLTRALRWIFLTRLYNHPVSLRHSLLLYAVGLYYGSITPGKSGELVRGYRYAGLYGISRKNGFLIIILERLFDIIVPGLFLLLFFCTHAVWLIMAGTLVLTPMLWMLAVRVLNLLTRWKWLSGFSLPAGPITREIIMASLLSTVTWSVFAILAQVILCSMQITVPFNLLLVAMALIIFAAVIPVTINGWGLRESALMWLLLPYMEGAQVLLFSVLWIFLTTYFIAAMGCIIEHTVKFRPVEPAPDAGPSHRA